MEAAADIREWMMRVMAEKNVSAAAWARRAGLAPSTVQKAIKEDYQYVTSTRTLSRLAQALGVAPPTVEQPSLIHQQPTFLMVRYKVGAGLWGMVDELSQIDYGSHPVAADPAYASFPQWLELVMGDSMNLEYPDGSYVHVVDAIEMGYAPRPGDHVIVQRTRGNGDQERTVKEVAFGPEGIRLIARSSNPVWANDPIEIAPDGHDREHCEVQIVGLVLGSYRSRRAR